MGTYWDTVETDVGRMEAVRNGRDTVQCSNVQSPVSS